MPHSLHTFGVKGNFTLEIAQDSQPHVINYLHILGHGTVRYLLPVTFPGTDFMRHCQSQSLIRSEKSGALINSALNQPLLVKKVKDLFRGYMLLASIFLQTNPHLMGDVVNILMAPFTSRNLFPVPYLGGVNLGAMVNSSISPGGHASLHATAVPARTGKS